MSVTAAVLATNRLDLVPATPRLVRAALESPAALGATLGVVVPDTWPPEYLDSPAFEYTLARLEESAEQAAWWLYFVVLRESAGRRVLIGSAGYKGPPSAEGLVEIGYGIVADRRRRGYATEAANGLIARAFADPLISVVLAETYPALVGSIGVLEKCGFRLEGAGSDPGVIRFRLGRSEYHAKGDAA